MDGERTNITAEMIERGAQALQAWHAPNTKLADVSKELAEVHRKLVKLILEAAHGDPSTHA